MAELLRIVRATEVDCLAQPGCDPFARAAEVAMASELSPVFQFGWLELADLGEFSVQVGAKGRADGGGGVARGSTASGPHLAVALERHGLRGACPLEPWRCDAKARELFRTASERWWQLLHQRSQPVQVPAQGAPLHLAMAAQALREAMARPGRLRGVTGLRPEGHGRDPLRAQLRQPALAVPPGGGCPGGAGCEGGAGRLGAGSAGERRGAG